MRDLAAQNGIKSGLNPNNYMRSLLSLQYENNTLLFVILTFSLLKLWESYYVDFSWPLV